MRFCLALLLVVLTSAPLQAAEIAETKVNALVKPYLDEKLIVGCAIGVIKDGEAWRFGYGETEKGSKRTPDADTIYEIGSTTKVFTGILLADMVRRKEVKLTDSLQSLLPADQVKVPTRGGKAITLEQVATHHSGLPRMPSNFRPADGKNPYADYKIEDAYQSLTDWQLPRDPGESYEYSNLATGVLGYGLGLKAKSSYEQLVVDRICNPLKMKDTRIALDPSQRKRMAPPYDESLEAAHPWDLPAFAGAGALRSTVNDMLKFLAANLATDASPLTHSLQAAQQERRKIPGGLAIGLGWHIARDGKTRWHNGQTGGYHAYMAVHREKKIAVVVLSNTASMQVDQLGEQIVQLAAGMEAAAPVRRKTVEVDGATLRKYVGKYPLAPEFVITITLEEGKLMAQATGQPKIEVYPESKTKFFYKVVDAQITFVEGKGGKAALLILHQNGRDMPAERAE